MARKKSKGTKLNQDQRSQDARKVNAQKEVVAERRVEDAAAARGIEKTGPEAINLEFELPTLTDIHIAVPPAAPVTEVDVDQRIQQLRHQMAQAENVGLGSRVEEGDQVLVDVMGYHVGDLFLSLVGEWMIVQENPQLPGFFAHVIGMFVGEEKAFDLLLSEDYIDEELRGQDVAFAVKVHGARRPTLPPLDNTFWTVLGVGTGQEARDAIRGELIASRADELVERAKEMVIDAILERANVHFDEDVLDHALNELWRHQQGDQLAAQNASLEAQADARTQFKADETLRTQMRRSLFERALLDKVIEGERLEPGENDVLKFILELVNGTSLSTNKVHESLTSTDGWDDAMHTRLRDMRAMEWILSRVQVEFTTP